MAINWFELSIFVVGILLSAFFSGSEAALISISVKRAKQLIDEGGKRAQALEYLVKKPNDILTTILIGNNLVNIFVASYATKIAERYFDDQAIAISVGVTTTLILIFGEIIPKTFARNHAERFSTVIIRVLQGLQYLLFPVVWIFMQIIKVVLGENANLNDRFVTKNDIEFMVNEAEKEQSIDAKQIDMLNSILEFPTIKVKDIMVPRNKVYVFKKTASFEEVITLIRDVAHSRYPVVEEDMDTTLGFLHVKDLAFVTPKDRENFHVEKYLKDPFFVYEHMKIQAVFDHMNRKKVHMALVKDENGLVVGIITLEDIMEEIFGEIQDEHDDEEEVVENAVESIKEGVVVDADISLRDLDSDYEVEIPLNDNYSTLTGFILDMLGNNFPKQGMILFWEGYSFSLEEVTDSIINKVKIQMTEEKILEERSPNSESTTV